MFEIKLDNIYDMKSLDYMNSICDNKVNNIAEINLPRDILNHYKLPKDINSHYYLSNKNRKLLNFA